MDAVFAMLAVIAFIDIPTDHLTLNIHHIKPVAGEHIHDLPVLHHVDAVGKGHHLIKTMRNKMKEARLFSSLTSANSSSISGQVTLRSAHRAG